MRIAINGTGVAGPTLAWWLRKYGFEPVLFEQAPALRTGGYMIDFWGKGYDIAEKMGLLPELKQKGYIMEELRMVDDAGRTKAGIHISDMSALIGGRFLSIARGDIAAAIYHACEGVETHFGTSIEALEPCANGVIARLSNGAQERFDLVVGADGLHSHIRALMFGQDENYEHNLGACVAAFTLSGYHPREELTYIMHTAPGMQLARTSLREDKTLFLFTFRRELVDTMPATEQEAKALLRTIYSEMGWEAPAIVARIDEAADFYFDEVSQIHLESWSMGRAVLLGDAAACASLLAGEGTGLAITEAYVLAGELYRAGADHATALRNYEERLRPFLTQKQKSAKRMVSFFAPKNHLQIALARMVFKLSSIPFLARPFLGDTLRDNIEVPDYEAGAGQ